MDGWDEQLNPILLIRSEPFYNVCFQPSPMCRSLLHRFRALSRFVLSLQAQLHFGLRTHFDFVRIRTVEDLILHFRTGPKASLTFKAKATNGKQDFKVFQFHQRETGRSTTWWRPRHQRRASQRLHLHPDTSNMIHLIEYNITVKWKCLISSNGFKRSKDGGPCMVGWGL